MAPLQQPADFPRSRRGWCLEALAWFYLFNLGVLMVVGREYLAAVPAGTSWPGWLLTGLAFVANFAFLALGPALLMAVAVAVGRWWLTAVVGVLGFGLLNVFIYADSVIYQLWRFHFNGMVWNLLTTAGASDSVTAGKSTVLNTLGIIGLIFVVQIAFAAVGLPLLHRRRLAARWRGGRLLWRLAVAVVALIVLDKVAYAIADLENSVEARRLRSILPVYQTITMKRFADRVLGIKQAPETRLHFKTGASSLDYPKSPLTFRADGPRPNIVIIAIEGARFDMLRPEVMPALVQWSTQNLVFDRHYSAGNTTRYGIFGLFYGLHGSYWQRAVAEREGPVLVKSLQSLGYQMRILCCTDLNYPEFRSTCFVDVPAAITDKWPGERLDRDRFMTDAFVKFVGEKRTPFLAFMFYDASHQPYRYPAEHAVFDVGGVTDDLNYLKLARDPRDMVNIRNRYQNSLHFVDAELGRALQALERNGLLTNTLVFIMGDHGEEFRECGLFGHDSAFNRYQTQTLMVSHIPGEQPRHITRLTSHTDVPATILTYLGVQNPLADYTQGAPLLADVPRPYVYVASWDTGAIIDDRTTTVFGLEAYKTETTVSDNDCTVLPDQRAALAVQTPKLVSVLGEMRQFTK